MTIATLAGCASEPFPRLRDHIDTTTDRTNQGLPSPEPTPDPEPTIPEIPQVEVRVLDRRGRPLEGVVVASSQDADVVDVSDPTDADGKTLVRTEVGSLLTAYATDYRLTTRVTTTSSSLVLRASHAYQNQATMPWQVSIQGVAPFENGFVYGCPTFNFSANSAGEASVDGYMVDACFDQDGNTTLVASTSDKSDWGFATTTSGNISIALEQATTTPVDVIALNLPAGTSWHAYSFFSRRSAFLYSQEFSPLDSGSPQASVPAFGFEAADSFGASLSNNAVLGSIWREAPLPLTTLTFDVSESAPTLDAFAIDASDGMRLTWTAGANGTADVFYAFVRFSDGSFWEVLLPPESGPQSLVLPPSPEALGLAVPSTAPSAARAALIDADFADGFADAAEIFAFPRPSQFRIARQERVIGPGLVFLPF